MTSATATVTNVRPDTRHPRSTVALPAPHPPVGWHAVYLKSLTLKGFESFASPTTLRFEPGITCVVGPNGSGQVQRRRRAGLGDGGAGRQDAARRQDGGRHLRRHLLAGAAGARRGDAYHRQLRQRAAHRVFRGVHHPPDVPRRRRRVRDQRQQLPAAGHPGTAERLRYRPRNARNRGPGPALADPESRPEDRRAFIEEAAGVLKHRKRKEKALRKLDSIGATWPG